MAKGVKTGGRQKGTPNKKTAAVKEALDMAFTQLGGVSALVKWGKENPTPFYQAWVKLLPQKVEGGDQPISHAIKVTFSQE